jgi:hypothetical protein
MDSVIILVKASSDALRIQPEIERGPLMRARYRLFVLIISCVVCSSLAGAADQAKQICPKPYIKLIFPWVARPGEPVKIQGDRFGAGRGEVIFAHKVKAEIISWTAHRILVIVPQSAASGPVVVKIPCGSESNQYAFEVSKIIRRMTED